MRTIARAFVIAAMLGASVLSSGLTATAAQSVPDSPRAIKLHDELMVEVELHVQHREKMLAVLFGEADRRTADMQRNDRLAALGYTGDLSQREYVLPVQPAQGYRLSAGFGATGPLWASVHTGLDFAAPEGTELVAVADGIVTEVAYAGPYGIRTVLTLEDGTEIWYNHQLRPLVFEGQAILIGEPIGLLGTTGNTTGPHLHLEVRPPGQGPVDPRDWLLARGLAP